MTRSVQQLQEYFPHLRMAETANELPILLRNAEKHSWTYLEFLEETLSFELKRREEKTGKRD